MAKVHRPGGRRIFKLLCKYFERIKTRSNIIGRSHVSVFIDNI